MNLNLDGERDTEREGRREMEEEKEWKFPKVKLTMIPRIKDNGVYYCRKGKKSILSHQRLPTCYFFKRQNWVRLGAT